MESDQSLLLKNIFNLTWRFLNLFFVSVLVCLEEITSNLLQVNVLNSFVFICFPPATADESVAKRRRSQCAFDPSRLASGNGMEQEVKNRGDKADNAIIPQ